MKFLMNAAFLLGGEYAAHVPVLLGLATDLLLPGI